MSIGNAISGVFGTINANKSIAAQKEENQKTREYNLSLAKLQNQWNIDQWHRENQYNSPAAQMARFKAAGLNPDLIYGHSNTGGQISGSLTSGAPANPADIGSLLSQKGNNISKAYGALGDAMMELPMYREELRAKRLDNDLKQEELTRSKFDSEVYSRFFGVGSTDWNNIMEDDSEFNALTNSMPAPVRLKFDAMRTQYFESKNVKEQWKERVISNAIGESTYQSVIKQIMATANITYDNARFIFDTYTERVAGCKAENMMLQTQAEWMTTEKFVEMGATATNILLNGYTATYGRKFGVPDTNKSMWTETYDSNGTMRKVVHRYEK